jgi:hypothetical protein
MRMHLALPTTAVILLTLLSFTVPAYASSRTTATFSGTARIHEVFVDGTQVRFTVPFSVTATAGGPGVGTLFLTLTGLPLPFPSSLRVGGFVATGSITVTSDSTSGGGTIAPPQASQEGFGVTFSAGGQFQCQNAGFSALKGLRQMDVHGSVAPGVLVTS